MQDNQELIGNLSEVQNGTSVQKYGSNKKSVYKEDYRERPMPTRDNKSIWKIREKAQVIANQYYPEIYY